MLPIPGTYTITFDGDNIYNYTITDPDTGGTKGVEGLQELVDVLTYIIQEDYKSGRFTNAAKNGYFCYTSSPANYAKVRKKLYGL